MVEGDPAADPACTIIETGQLSSDKLSIGGFVSDPNIPKLAGMESS